MSMLARRRRSKLLVDREVLWVRGRVLALSIRHIVQHLTRQLNVIVSELADLRIVDTQDLSFLRGAERETGNQVHDEEDEAGAAERVDAAGDGVGELVAELYPVVVEPAAGDLGKAVEVRYVVCGEEGGEDVADEPADGVFGEDVERVVDAEEEFELRGVVGACGSDDAVDDGCPGWDEPGARSDGDETGDDAGAEADGGPLAFETVVEDAPGNATDAGSEVGDHGGHDGAEVGGEG